MHLRFGYYSNFVSPFNRSYITFFLISDGMLIIYRPLHNLCCCSVFLLVVYYLSPSRNYFRENFIVLYTFFFFEKQFNWIIVI